MSKKKQDGTSPPKIQLLGDTKSTPPAAQPVPTMGPKDVAMRRLYFAAAKYYDRLYALTTLILPEETRELEQALHYANKTLTWQPGDHPPKF